jgi:DNA-binding transcriptional MocR family regulator
VAGLSVKPQPWYRQIADNLRADITAGVLADGQVLPSTRELAEELQASTFTISQAMKLLEGEGLITCRARSRRIVRAPKLSDTPAGEPPAGPDWTLITIVAPPAEAARLIVVLAARGYRAGNHGYQPGPGGAALTWGPS